MSIKKIKGKAKEVEGIITAKVLMQHPMEPGTRKHKKTGELIPAHYIKEVSCMTAGKNIYTAYFGGGIAKNPFLSFKFLGAAKGDAMKVVWKDNHGESGETQFKIR